MKKEEAYKTSLKLKTVNELVDIILRKDDKEKEKNRQINHLERKINNYKEYQKNVEEEVARNNDEYNKLSQKAHSLQQDIDIYKYKYDVVRHRNVLIKIAISVIGAIAIIEFLALMFS